MKHFKSIDEFLLEQEGSEGEGYIKYIGDVQFRIIATSLTDIEEIKKLPLRAESFLSSDVAKETTEHSVKLKSIDGSFSKRGGTRNMKTLRSLKDSVTVQCDGKDFTTVCFKSDEIPPDDGFKIQVVDFPKDFENNGQDLSLRFARVMSSSEPETNKNDTKSFQVAMTTRAAGVTKSMAIGSFKEFGYSYMADMEKRNNTVSLSGSSNVVYLIYAPENTPPAPDFDPVRFVDSFEYNSTKINKNDKFKKSITDLLNQIQKMKEAGGKYILNIEGSASTVPTDYEGGNEKLAEDRATAMLKEVNKILKDNNIDIRDIIVDVKKKSSVNGDAYDKSHGSEYYKEWQYVKIGFEKAE